MGIRASKNYQPLRTADESIELEDYTRVLKAQRNSSDLSHYVQKLIIQGLPLLAYDEIQRSGLDSPDIFLSLHCLEFIEIIKKQKIFDAMVFAQNYLSKGRNDSFTLNADSKPLNISVSDLIGLLCYENPENSVLGYLLDPSLRYSFAAHIESILNPYEPEARICKFFKCCKRKTNTE
ncbi:hypothetical protein SteCoe_26099 [Stentor coeruleus]|uniref:CTLH domain-containing protein n=1 Tax=Stentor coeruleus TaxID=5963 RepID=A0A1R2BDR0_9CILI|nr:hypothetical protein SteCoe_26099 [Stentor coeruleus]